MTGSVGQRNQTTFFFRPECIMSVSSCYHACMSISPYNRTCVVCRCTVASVLTVALHRDLGYLKACFLREPTMATLCVQQVSALLCVPCGPQSDPRSDACLPVGAVCVAPPCGRGAEPCPAARGLHAERRWFLPTGPVKLSGSLCDGSTQTSHNGALLPNSNVLCIL